MKSYKSSCMSIIDMISYRLANEELTLSDLYTIRKELNRMIDLVKGEVNDEKE